MNSTMPDPSKRFSPTPLVANLALTGISLHLETNHQGLRERFLALFPEGAECDTDPVFSLRIVVESEDEYQPSTEDLSVHDFDLNGLGYIMIGRKSFLAYDQRACQAFSFLTSELVRHDEQFNRYFLQAFRSMVERIGPPQ
jgi:hypothetical protein